MHFPPTPVLTHHARERCAEMGISTKVAKAIVRDKHATTYPGRRGTNSTVYISRHHPRYLAVVSDVDGRVLTVAFNTPGVEYIRNGEDYIPIG